MCVRYPNRHDWQIDDYVEHVIEALSSCEHPLLIAESFSGPIAWKVAQRMQVLGIVFVASFLSCPNALLRVFPMLPANLINRAASSDILLRLMCLGRDASDDCVLALQQAIRSLPTKVLRARVTILLELNATDESSLGAPSLCLQSSHDRLVSGAQSRNLALRTNSSIIAIDGPHFLLQTRPQAAISAIRQWLVEHRLSD